MMKIQSATSGFLMGTLLVLAISYVAAGERVRSPRYHPANITAAIAESGTLLATAGQAAPAALIIHVDENGSVWLRLGDSAKTKELAALIQAIEQHSEAATSINRLVRISTHPRLVEGRDKPVRS